MADEYVSRTGSSRGYYKQNGELIARPHPTMKKSYAGNADQGKAPATRCAEGEAGEGGARGPPQRAAADARRRAAAAPRRSRSQHHEGVLQKPQPEGGARCRA